LAVVSRAIVVSDVVMPLSWAMPPMPVPVSAGAAAGAIAAVSAGMVSAFFSPQPTIASVAASIMIFFIVAPDTLGLALHSKVRIHGRRVRRRT
jgi:hypothetical protein